MIPDFETWRHERILTRQYNMTAGAVVGGAVVATLALLLVTGKALTIWACVPSCVLFAGILASVRHASTRLRWFYFPKAFSVGLSISCYASLFIGVLWYMYTSLINPEFIRDFFQTAQTSLLRLIPADLDAEEAEIMTSSVTDNIRTAIQSTTPLSYAFSKMCNAVFCGAVAALLAAIFHHRRRVRTVESYSTQTEQHTNTSS